MPVKYPLAIFLLVIIVSSDVLKANSQEYNLEFAMGLFKPGKVSTFATTSLRLDGSPKGGEIELFVFNTIVRITTSPSDSASKVANNLASAINTNVALQHQGITATTKDSTLVLANVCEYNLSLCITDKGIHVPPKPRMFSIAVRSEDHVVDFRWKNPEGCYDRIHIVETGIPIGKSLPGTITSFSYDYLSPDGHIYTGIHTYRIVGVVNGVPSCAAMYEVFLKMP